ncbi:thioredoxin fold domain-containing protein [Candidatus Bathyarchaeota archaeon]|nr:thioredoxin fold domain-containing protein [Candidatus Bathyarchaeota archaeon]MBS7636718.1 thioredoxin fold domain-containing protein [Candidatus Bathyarchaeota archaeon]
MEIVNLSPVNWDEEVTRSSILTLVYFWHERCPWCRELTPIFEKVASDYFGKIKFARLNILESPANRELAVNLGVMSTPTLMFFCGGRPLMQVVGFMAEEDLRKTLDEMLGKYRACLRQSTDLRSYIF